MTGSIQIIDPSADAISTVASKLRYCADQFDAASNTQHRSLTNLLRKQQHLCEAALDQKAHQKWVQPERMDLRYCSKWVL